MKKSLFLYFAEPRVMMTLQIWRGCFFDGTDDSSIRAPHARAGKVWGGRERERETEGEGEGRGRGGKVDNYNSVGL